MQARCTRTGRTFSPGFANAADVADVILATAPGEVTPAALPVAGLLDEIAAKNGLKGQTFTAVGYGMTERVKSGPGAPQLGDTNLRMLATESFNALGPAWLHMSQNPATGNGGACSGDSGGPNFLRVGDSNVIAGITVTGDRWCRSTNVAFRLDTPAARDFLRAGSRSRSDCGAPVVSRSRHGGISRCHPAEWGASSAAWRERHSPSQRSRSSRASWPVAAGRAETAATR